MIGKGRTLTYTVVIDRDTDAGGFVATCLALPGVVTEGETVEETLDMAKDAVRGYLESLQKDGLPIPTEQSPLVSLVTVQLALA
ncbi:MAG: type II toxin-antitoxin system HicB family antitoxin [Rhizomicrobium sp.]|nr:type II toxin-antitoxin system HicB family antitoxin [Rhizomicrobium sp.]